MRNRVLLLGILTAWVVAAMPTSRAATLLPAGFSAALVADGLSSPTAMTIAPDGRIFVCEKAGRIRVVADGVLQAAPFATIAVNDEAERGLLGIALDPLFPASPYVYAYYTVPGTGVAPIHNRVSRFTAAGDVVVPGSERVLLELDPVTSTLHNAGAIEFGVDGKLYVAVGDDARGAVTAQSLSTRFGKLLRIDADGAIPADNPFAATASGANRAIWAYGLRNPFKIAVNRGGGTPTLFINDVGGSAFEEVNEGIAGANYGYPHNEGYVSHPDYTSPRHAYDHGPTGGCAITGGAFYTAGAGRYPSDYVGSYFFADFCAGFIRRLDPARGDTVTDFALGVAAPVDLRVHDGYLYYLSIEDGAVYRVDYGATLPAFTTQPGDVVVAPGEPAVFTAAASASTPVAYQWQRNGVDIPGATAATYRLTSPQSADAGSRFRVRATTGAGSVLSREAVLSVAPNLAPTATITAPDASLRYAGAMTIAFAGTAIDPEDGPLAPAAFTWRVDFHHDTHAHPFVPATAGIAAGSFVVPVVGETSANVWYRLTLTVADSRGRTHTAVRDVHPQVVALTLDTDPPGLALRLDGQMVPTPHTVEAVVGVARTIAAEAQTVAGARQVFAAWSDGGAPARAIVTPPVPTTLTARFRTADATAIPAAPGRPVLTSNGRTLHVAWTRVVGATSYQIEAGSVAGEADRAVVDVGDVGRVQAVVPPGLYAVRVRAVNRFGASAASPDTLERIDSPAVCDAPPPAPADFTGQAGGVLAALSWAPAPGATGYVLEAGSGPGRADLARQPLGGVTTFAATAPPGTYHTRVRATNACGAGPASYDVVLTLGCAADVAPVGLDVEKTGGVVRFSWLPPLGAVGYRLRVGTAPGLANLADIDVGTATTIAADARSVAPGTYYVHVAARSACGLSAASNEVAVTVP